MPYQIEPYLTAFLQLMAFLRWKLLKFITYIYIHAYFIHHKILQDFQILLWNVSARICNKLIKLIKKIFKKKETKIIFKVFLSKLNMNWNHMYLWCLLFICLMVFNATFNNISVISWRSVLLVEETRGPRENHRPVPSHWQTLSHNVVHLDLIEIRTRNINGERHWLHR